MEQLPAEKVRALPLPWHHVSTTPNLLNHNGLWLPCKGPHLIRFGEDGKTVVCGRCGGEVARNDGKVSA